MVHSSSTLLVPNWGEGIRTVAHETRRQASSAPHCLSRGRTSTLSANHKNKRLQNKTHQFHLTEECFQVGVCMYAVYSYLENPDAQQCLQHKHCEAHEVHYLKAKVLVSHERYQWYETHGNGCHKSYSLVAPCTYSPSPKNMSLQKHSQNHANG